MDTVLRIGLTNAAWAAALALAAAVIVRVWRQRPALAHGLWLLVLLKLATPGLVSIAFPSEPSARAETSSPPNDIGKSPALVAKPSRQAEPSSPVGTDGLPASVFEAPRPEVDAAPDPRSVRTLGGEPPAPRHIRETNEPQRRGQQSWPWKTVLLSIWLGGAVAWCLNVAIQMSRFGQLLRAARPASESLHAKARQLASRLGLRHCPDVVLVPARVPPMLSALFGRPRVLLPEELWSDLNESQRDSVLAHELIHLRRGDHWVRRLEAIVLGLYWWNPFAWLARREVERAEELCCDAWVTWALPESASAYARALVKTAEFLSGPQSPWPLGASGVGHVPLLKGRLSMILRTPSKRPAPRVLVLLATLTLPLLPTWASGQTPGDPPQNDAAPAVEQAPAAKAKPKQREERPKAETPKDEANAQNPGAPPRVKVARPIVKQVADYADFTGRIEAAQSVEVRPRVSGVLTGVERQPGAMVKKGDVLFQIDPRPYQAELDKAEAEVQVAEAQMAERQAVVARNSRMTKRDPQLVPEESRTQAESQLAAARAQVAVAKATRDLAQLNLGFTRITAPISGQLGNILLDAGNVVAADTSRITTIVGVDPVYVYFDVDERTLVQLTRRRREEQAKGGEAVALPVEVRLMADQSGPIRRGNVGMGGGMGGMGMGGTGMGLMGGRRGFALPADESVPPRRSKVEVLANRIDPATGTAVLRAILPNPDKELLPGMSSHVRLFTGPTHEALLIPETAFGPNLQSNALLVVNDRGAVEPRTIWRGLQFENMRSVTKGLSPDDWFLVDFWDGMENGRPPGMRQSMELGGIAQGLRKSVIAERITLTPSSAPPAQPR